MLFMVVIPLVFTTLTLGVASFGDLRRLGRVGGKTIGFFVFTTALAVALGLILADTMKPGASLDPAAGHGADDGRRSGRRDRAGPELVPAQAPDFSSAAAPGVLEHETRAGDAAS